MLNPLCDPRSERVVERLHFLGDRQSKSLVLHYLLNVIPKRWIGRKYTYPDRKFMLDKLVPLDRDKCYLSYLLCRTVNAKRVVEFATSFGVSTIYLAAAVRDNARADGTGGIVIGTEIESKKVAAARAADRYPEYLARVRAPTGGYLSIPFAGDVELSMKLDVSGAVRRPPPPLRASPASSNLALTKLAARLKRGTHGSELRQERAGVAKP